MFWCPTKLQLVDGTVQEFPIPTNPELKVNFNNSYGLQYEAERVRKCILEGISYNTDCIDIYGELFNINFRCDGMSDNFIVRIGSVQ